LGKADGQRAVWGVCMGSGWNALRPSFLERLPLLLIHLFLCVSRLTYRHAPFVGTKFPQNVKKEYNKLGGVAHTSKPSTQETEAGGSWVWGQPGIHSKTLSQPPPHTQNFLKLVTNTKPQNQEANTNHIFPTDMNWIPILLK
jgi:hypothetical protein